MIKSKKIIDIFYYVSLCILLMTTLLVRAEASLPSIEWASLSKEAQQTVVLIQQGGPFPYVKDGTTFGNYERQLPVKRRGYYREYTVAGSRAWDRGAARIVVGGTKKYPKQFYYTNDHYKTFKTILLPKSTYGENIPKGMHTP